MRHANQKAALFEVYGWASIGSDPGEIANKADAELLSALRPQIEQAQTVNMVIRLDTGMNGSHSVLTVAGMNNHRYQPRRLLDRGARQGYSVFGRAHAVRPYGEAVPG